jgi:hypothetical protein
MAVALGNTAGPPPPLRTVTMAAGATPPAGNRAGHRKKKMGMDYFTDRSLADYCGLRLRK